jgi:cytochrome c
MKRAYVLAVATLVTISFYVVGARSDGNPNRGQRVFGACAACHSLQPDQNMTGPSLAGLWNRKAGSVANFNWYSPALQQSNIVWNDKTLDDWIKDPQLVMPENQMTFAGIKDSQQRADLLAYLKEAMKKGSPQTAQQGGMGGMGGMMGGGRVPNLKNLNPEDRVQTITYCKDTYTITTANGQTRKFWERNLPKDRFEAATDSKKARQAWCPPE